jgi:DNA-binding transcriptional ArsR family regulator
MTYIYDDSTGKNLIQDTMMIHNASSLSVLSHPIRIKILKLLSKKPMYPAELAKVLKMHEQKVYYHVKLLIKEGILEIVSREEIRGTVAKKLSPKSQSFSFVLSNKWQEFEKVQQKQNESILKFFKPFIQKNSFNCNIVVGSPDPHGPHKARARDGHYAIDLALFLGNYSILDKSFSTMLDVDIDLKEPRNLILVGGPVTNLVVAKLNEFIPASFSDKKPWGIKTKSQLYTEESVGLICKIPNPYNPDYSILIIAGIRFIGTKSAVLAITRYTDQIIDKYKNQKQFYAIVQGFDLDGDGKIDNIEVLE